MTAPAGGRRELRRAELSVDRRSTDGENSLAICLVELQSAATVSAAELRPHSAASLAPEEKIIFDWSVLDERLTDLATLANVRRRNLAEVGIRRQPRPVGELDLAGIVVRFDRDDTGLL